MSLGCHGCEVSGPAGLFCLSDWNLSPPFLPVLKLTHLMSRHIVCQRSNLHTCQQQTRPAFLIETPGTLYPLSLTCIAATRDDGKFLLPLTEISYNLFTLCQTPKSVSLFNQAPRGVKIWDAAIRCPHQTK
ncbi:hypothetical protein BaRGS_00014880 [Batillaria attramentaria]|uniref:Uncharacterized protein n=1 Tax=Batillaria attramentaria TaxID=370345 RepID=A0ABD0L441_9CAEN